MTKDKTTDFYTARNLKIDANIMQNNMNDKLPG